MEVFERLIRRQCGLFTRGQARHAGFSAYQIRRRLAAGTWVTVLGPVLTAAGTPITAAIRDRAAAMATPGSVLAGPSAARAFGMPVRDPRTYVWLPGRREIYLPGVHRLPGMLTRRDVILVEGLRATDPARTVFDCARLLDDRASVELLEWATHRGWINAAAFIERVREHVGRQGAPKLARLAPLVASGARSEAERIAIRMFIHANVSGWTANSPIFDADGLIGVGDIVFDRHRIVVEIDGWAHHHASDRFQHDRHRQNRLVQAGWTVLRFTWHDLADRPTYVIDTVRALLRTAA